MIHGKVEKVKDKGNKSGAAGQGEKIARPAVLRGERGAHREKGKAGGGLLSRLWAVSSAQGRLTSVFGTGTGISAPPWPPAYKKHFKKGRRRRGGPP